MTNYHSSGDTEECHFIANRYPNLQIISAWFDDQIGELQVSYETIIGWRMDAYGEAPNPVTITGGFAFMDYTIYDQDTDMVYEFTPKGSIAYYPRDDWFRKIKKAG